MRRRAESTGRCVKLKTVTRIRERSRTNRSMELQNIFAYVQTCKVHDLQRIDKFLSEAERRVREGV